MKNNKVIHVLVPVYRPDEKFRYLIERLNKQELLPDKLLLMVTVPTGREEAEVREEMNLFLEDSRIPFECHYLPQQEFDHGGTRNKGMQCSDADYVICMTQDAVPADKKLTKELLRPFEGEFCGAESGIYGEKEILIAYGRQLPAKDCRPEERYTRKFNYPKTPVIKTAEDLPRLGIKTFFASDVCACYRREAYLREGGFPEHTIFNEDMIFAGRAVKNGYAIAYAADARVIHSHNLSGEEQFHRNFDLAVSQAEAPDVFEGIRSEGEGIRLVKETAMYLLKTGRLHRLPVLVYMSGCKYLGYFLGKRYRKLPEKIVLSCTMNKRWWDRNRK